NEFGQSDAIVGNPAQRNPRPLACSPGMPTSPAPPAAFCECGGLIAGEHRPSIPPMHVQSLLWKPPTERTEHAPCCEREGEDRTRPTKHEKAAGITRAAFLVSRPVASTTVVPTQ